MSYYEPDEWMEGDDKPTCIKCGMKPFHETDNYEDFCECIKPRYGDHMADNPIEETGETVKWQPIPEGEKGLETIARLSTNMRKEVQQKYITLGCCASVYPNVPTEELIKKLENLGFWED